MGSFWREVFDFSEAAQTPARVKAAAQVSAVLGVVALAATIVAGFSEGWSSTYVIIFGGLVLFGASQSIRLHYESRRRPRRRTGSNPSRPGGPDGAQGMGRGSGHDALGAGCGISG